MFDKNWNNSPVIDSDIVQSITNNDLLVSLFRKFPSFENAEISEFLFTRGNTLDCMNGIIDWKDRIGPTLLVDLMVPLDDCGINEIVRVKIRFSDIDRFCLNGLNHQNVICGLGVRIYHSDRLLSKMFRVDWGGSALTHQVSLECHSIIIEEVQKLRKDPCR